MHKLTKVVWYRGPGHEAGDPVIAVVKVKPDGDINLDCGGVDFTSDQAAEIAKTILRLAEGAPRGEEDSENGPKDAVELMDPEIEEWCCRTDPGDRLRLYHDLDGEVEFICLGDPLTTCRSAVLDESQVREVRDWLDQWLRWRATQNEEE